MFQKIYELISGNKKIVLARIIRRHGSAPRAVGSKCIMTEDGNIFGTIGGGLLEHKVFEQAMDVFRQGNSKCFEMRLSGKDVADSNMICGGEVEVYLDPLFPDNKDLLTLYSNINELIENGQEGVLLTKVDNGISALDPKARMLLGQTGAMVGQIEGLEEEAIDIKGIRVPELVSFPLIDSEVLVEPIKQMPTLFLFGAGHVAACVSPLASMVGFRVVIIDDRTEFAREQRFPNADEIKVLPFPNAFEQLTINDSSYVVIVTRGHLHDRIVLEAALQTEPAYIGMIGSKRKNALIMQALREKGIPEQRIAQVHAPIGIAIAAETPEEIAVSIVAELIKTRALRNGKSKIFL